MDTLESKSLAALVSIEGIGQRTVASLCTDLHAQNISWEEFWESGATLWKNYAILENKIDSIEKFIKEQTMETYYEKLKTRNIRVITKDSSEYPPLLKEVENGPVVLFAQGSPMEWTASVPIAVVGTRHMTAYGKLVTEKIARELVCAGAQIISGFMYGVDTCAHLTALENQGKTVGVLGFGFDYMYPSSHKKVFRQCLENGMSFVTPFAPAVQPNKGNFPARNAIVAGMSAAVVVTEAAEKSGTHITAGFAADFGRTVCAVPGPITSPYSAGTKSLVNQGAVLVSSGSEVLESLGLSHSKTFGLSTTAVQSFSEKETLIIKILRSSGGQSLNNLLVITKLPPAELLTVITELELKQQIAREGDTWMICS
jgi:DNA processing protein